MRNHFNLISLFVLLGGCGKPVDLTSTQLNRKQDFSSPPESSDSKASDVESGYIRLNGQVVKVPYQVENDKAVVGGDMAFDLSQVHSSPDIPPNLAAYTSGVTKWPGGVVPYVLSPGFPYTAELNQAIQKWVPAGITWKPRTTEATYMTFAVDTAPVTTWCGLYTYSSNLLQIKSNLATCLPLTNIILHEMAHGLGMLHEHQRTDRNSFLKGIPVGSAYDIVTAANINLSPFDLSSITIYPTAIIPTLRTIAGAVVATPINLSAMDLDRTSAYYFGDFQCSIIGGQGSQLFSGLTSKYGCNSQCSSRAATNPDRSCAWQNVTFFGLSQCSIVGGLGTQLFSGSSTKFQCTQECNARGLTNPDRTCSWNNVIFAGAAQCSIIGGLGTTLYSGVVGKFSCVTECRNRAVTNANRTCVWNGINIKGQ